MNFSHNYPAAFDSLAEAQDHELDTMNNLSFVLNTVAVTNTFEVVGKLSRKTQQPDAIH